MTTISEFQKRSKSYRNVLEHRTNCPKWGNSFCLECFGGGLTRFTEEIMKELLIDKKREEVDRK